MRIRYTICQPVAGSLVGAAADMMRLFLLCHKDWESHPPATISSSRSGIKMDVLTDREAMHVHTWNQADGKRPETPNEISPALNSLHDNEAGP